MSAKLRDGQILFVDSLALGKDPKTSVAAEIVQAFAGMTGFEKLANARKPKAMIVIPSVDRNITNSFRNIPQTSLSLAKDLNTLDILNHQYLIVVAPESSVEVLTKRCVVSKKLQPKK